MISILVASTKEDSLFYLTKQYAIEELQEYKNSKQFFCPSCGASVILKIGKIKTPHFAHRSLSYCDSYSEPESPIHLQGKLLLYQFFSSKNFTVELEKYLPAIRQRADLLINQQTAIEFQCSPVPASQITERTQGYTNIGIRPIWIGGIADPVKEGIQLLKLTAWKKELVSQNQKNNYVLFFAPEENRFYYYSNLFYISGNQWIGKVKSLAAEKQPFPFAVPKRLTKQEFQTMYSVFYQVRKRYIASQFFVKNRLRNLFWRTCYELQLEMAKLPDAIGIPMANAEQIPCNAVLWQLKAIEAAQKGISAASLIGSGQLPLIAGNSRERAEALLEAYIELYWRLIELGEGNAGSGDLLYDYYCKTL